MRRRGASLGFGVALVALSSVGLAACPNFSSGQCTDLAVCDDSADGTAPLDGTMGGDVVVDSPPKDVLTNPTDGPLPDGNCCLTVPGGWAGPVALWQGSSKGAVPTCAGSYAGASASFHAGLTADPATCGTCGCNPPLGQVCTSTIQIYNLGACTGGTCGSPITVSNGCTNYGPCSSDGSSQSYSATDAVSSVTCTANGGAPTVPALTWDTAAITCAYSDTTSGCSGGTCYAAASAPFLGPCVTQAGMNTCPAAFPNQNIVYTGETDTRGCTMCTCGGSSGGSCNNYLQFWHGSGCSDFPVTSADPPSLSCGDTYTTSYVGGSVKGDLTVTGGSCSSTGGGQPTGSATATGVTTICCE